MIRFRVINNFDPRLLDIPCSRAEKWLANEVLKTTVPYVPALTGTLSKSAIAIGKSVIYPGPYARYLYHGKAMKGPYYGPKYVTDKNLVYTKSMHKKAQSHWLEASKEQNLEEWMKGVKKIIAKRK